MKFQPPKAKAEPTPIAWRRHGHAHTARVSGWIVLRITPGLVHDGAGDHVLTIGGSRVGRFATVDHAKAAAPTLVAVLLARGHQ